MPRLLAATLITATLLSMPWMLESRPNRYGHSDREERHMLPSVSSGPLSPAWSPDGRWLAFSMRGDIWKVPADGGEAIAITSGPAYYFEPAWSPDGSRIAFAYQSTGNLEIGVTSAAGGPVAAGASHSAALSSRIPRNSRTGSDGSASSPSSRARTDHHSSATSNTSPRCGPG